MSDFWIPITYDETAAKKLEKAVIACHKVHVYTLKTLNEYFITHTENLLLREFRKGFAEFLPSVRKGAVAQHYTLTKAAEKTFPYFSENKKINKNGKFITVKPIPAKEYRDIQIESRQVWHKYLALNSLITTTYGTIHLEKDEWPEILASQAAEKGIGFDFVPLLWHSIVIHLESGNDKLRFNLHEPNSKYGKRSIREMKQHV